MTLEQKAEKVGKDCFAVGLVVAEHGDAMKKRVALLRIVNVVVSMALFITLIPAFSATIGTVGANMIAVIAGIVLLLDTVLPLFVGKDSPERYEDYAKYIMGYKDFLDETLVDTTLSPEVRQARLTEIIRLAQVNLRDVRSKWPGLVKRALPADV
jgi:hypothetical protein